MMTIKRKSKKESGDYLIVQWLTESEELRRSVVTIQVVYDRLYSKTFQNCKPLEQYFSVQVQFDCD